MMKMASLAISIPTHLCCSPSSSSSSSTNIKSAAFSSYPAQISSIGFSSSISQVGFSWNGLRVASISLSLQLIRKDRKRRRCREKSVYASLFGVGAPEALVIGVVALLVFGPKGLAEVARTLGKTLRAFQPTIRELQDVSREFKSTLEREIGLDDVSNPLQNNYTSSPPTRTPIPNPPPTPSTDTQQIMVDNNGAPSPSRAYSSEEYLKITEEQLKAAAVQQQLTETASPPAEDQLVSQQNQTQSSGRVQESTLATTPPPKTPESTPS